jgi:hypothetical protein
MRKFLFDVITFLLTIFTVTAASADIIQLNPVKDNTMYEESGDQSLGAGNHTFMGMTSGDKSIDPSLRRTLVAFDLSSIPSNAVINSVQLSFTIDQAPGQSATSDFASLHRLLSDWGEGASYTDRPGGLGAAAEPGDATWTHTFYDTGTWDTPGGDYGAIASASAPFGSSVPETMTFVSTEGLKADVLAWVRNPAINFGWLLRGDEDTEKNARRLGSRENINLPVPLLTIDYTIPSVIDHLSLSQITAALTNPVSIANAGDGSGRLFIVEQEGIIRIYDLETDTLLATPFLDISSKVDDSGNEQGLLGLAFHPAFSSNRQFYVYYTRDPGAPADRSVVAMYQASVADPNIADSTEVVIMEFEQNAANHNGGDLHFGQDGYLYIATGDGGGRDDQYSNAQNLDTLKGAILRIDVDGAPPGSGELCGLVANYAIPPGNPFTMMGVMKSCTSVCAIPGGSASMPKQRICTSRMSGRTPGRKSTWYSPGLQAKILAGVAGKVFILSRPVTIASAPIPIRYSSIRTVKETVQLPAVIFIGVTVCHCRGAMSTVIGVLLVYG